MEDLALFLQSNGTSIGHPMDKQIIVDWHASLLGFISCCNYDNFQVHVLQSPRDCKCLSATCLGELMKVNKKLAAEDARITVGFRRYFYGYLRSLNIIGCADFINLIDKPFRILAEKKNLSLKQFMYTLYEFVVTQCYGMQPLAVYHHCPPAAYFTPQPSVSLMSL